MIEPSRIFHGPPEPKKYAYVVHFNEGDARKGVADLACLIVSRRRPEGGLLIVTCETEPAGAHARDRSWRCYCDDPAAGILACRNASRGLT